MKLTDLVLKEEDKRLLEEIFHKGQDWRMRDRAQTILKLARGEAAKAIAEEQGLCCETIYNRRRNWLNNGFAGLADKIRRGAPKKLKIYEDLISEWATAEPLSASDIHKRLIEEFDVKVHGNTVRGALKKVGLVWKRTGYSLKKT